MSCATPKSKILSNVDRQEIIDEHKGLFIEGINFNQQRSIVKSIANELYRNTISGNKETSLEIKDRIVTHLDSQLTELDESIETFELLEDQDAVIDIKEQKAKIQTIKDNLDKLIGHSELLLKTFSGLNVSKALAEIDTQDDDQDKEALLERTDFSSNFYLELNTRDTVSSRLKKFLAFVERKDYVNGVAQSVPNIIGSNDFLEFEYVFNELHRILEGTKTSQKAVLERLQEEANVALQTENKNSAWVQDFIQYFIESSDDTKAEFVSEMAKHRIEMMFVDYNITKDKDGNESYQLFLNSDDSGSTTNKLLQVWKRNHNQSVVIKDDKYSPEVIKQIELDIEVIRDKATSKAAKVAKTSNILSSVGIHLHPKYLDSIAYGGKKVGPVNWAGIISKGGKLENIIKNLPAGAEVGNYEFIKDTFIKNLAKGNSRFEENDFSNSFRVADKTIYTYSMNQYLVNRVRDLVDKDDTVRANLEKTIFTQDSLYLSQLMDEDGDFRDWFDVNYLSLNPLKVRKGRRSDSVTEMSPLDYEVTKYGNYLAKSKFSELEVNNLKHKVRNATYFFPTNSDKSRVMTINGMAFESTEDDKFTHKAISLFYDSVVVPEINRIHDTNDKSFKEAVNLKTFNGGIFYLLPSLNNIVFEEIQENGEVVNKSLLDVARDPNGLSAKQKEVVFKEIKNVLEGLVNDKLEKWKEVGILENGKLVHLPKTRNSKSTAQYEKLYSNKEMAMNEVFNYMIANANMYQLIIGDPAQYYKGSNTIEGEVKGTYDNLTKRLAAEIAPGVEMEGKDYLQVYIDEVKVDSNQYEYFKDKLGEKNAKAYLGMKSADAQEYTTWREHLNILKYLGRITNAEYEEASAAFIKEEEPSKDVFDKVLQPLKPVFAWNDTVPVGDKFYDRKTYIKSSSFPLIPTLTIGMQLDGLRLAMESLENSSTKNPDGLGVRAAIASAVKVGMPINSLELTKDKQGNFVDEIDLTGKYTRLKREGFRIQQDIPYDETASSINDGTQNKKLLFTNYSNPKLEAEYIDTYRKLYELGKSTFNRKILNKDGKVDNAKLSELLEQELLTRGETSKPLYDGLKVLDNKFSMPLWMSPYADTYMSLLNSIVKNAILTHRFPGKSLVLGSDVGFKPTILEGEEGQEYINKNKTGIIFTDSYDPTKGLQIQRDEDGEVKGAQVLMPFKFRDSEGNLLYAKDFVVDGKLDYTRLPKDILKMFGFRIPTQLHASMAFIEIVGFLPKVNGDLIIAPAEFVTQMGSDFDVDKLYAYMYSTEYDKKNKALSKSPYMIDYEEQKSKLKTSEAHKELEVKYQAGLYNKLLDIRLEVMRDKALQANIHSPLGFGLFDSLIPVMKSYDKRAQKSMLSDQYQEDKFFDGTSGKNGIGMFSSDSIFNALAQNKDLNLIKGFDLDFNPIGIYVEFGKEYNIANSFSKIRDNEKYSADNRKSSNNLSAVKSLKKVNPRNKTDVIAAMQNLSVDNANEQGMHVVNMNNHTFGVYSILNFLGFEEDISAPFMAQQIIRDYVAAMNNKNSILKEYDPKAEDKIVEELKLKYGQNIYKGDEHSKLANFKGKDASKEMMSMLENPSEYNMFGLYQAAILDRFMELKKLNSPLGPIKQLLNLDSKGFSKNMYINKRRLEVVATANEGLVMNAGNLFGDYTDNAVIPTTTAGFDNILGNLTLVSTFGEYFLESNSKMEFSNIVGVVEQIKGDNKNLSEKALVKLKNDYKNYLLSNLNVEDVDAVRKELFLNKAKGSFYDRLSRFKETAYGKENKFLNNTIVTFDKMLEVDYNNSGGDMFDESSIYKSFVDLFMDSNDRNGIIPSDLVEELIMYSLLRGGNKAQQFIKFIPISALNKIVSIPEHGAIDTFIDQWIRHNSYEANLVPKENTESVDGRKVIQVVDEAPKYIRVKLDDNKIGLYRQKVDTVGTYILINELGTMNTTEYTPYTKTNSILQFNNIRKVHNPQNKVNPLKVYAEEEIDPTGIKTNMEVSTTDLNFESVTDLLTSIVNLNSPKYQDEIKLAQVLLPNLNKETKLTTSTNTTSHYSTAENAININRDLKSGKDLLITILHETLHSLSSDFIHKFNTGQVIPLEIQQSLIRLNGFKNQIIDNLSGEVKERFDEFYSKLIYKYLVEGKTTKVENIILKPTTHPRIKGLVEKVKLYKEQIDNNLATTDKTIEKYISSDKEPNSAEGYFFYSLMNLDEFVAVAGTIGRERDNLVRLAGGKYIEEIKNLFEKILEFLGITKNESAKFLTDIFTVSGIKEEVEVAPNVETVQNKVPNPVTFKGKMTFMYNANKRPEVTSKTTLEAIEKGERTATTRYETDGHLDYWKKANVGDIIEFEGTDGSIVKVEVTKSLEKLSNKFSSETIADEWSKLEGWSVNYFKTKVAPKVNTAWQMEYKVLNSVQEVQPNKQSPELDELEDLGKELIEKCKGSSTKKAKDGMKTSLNKGSQWSIVKDLKGMKSHKQGGVDLSIVDGSVHMIKGNTTVQAKYGAYIKSDNEDLESSQKNSTFTVPLYSSKWEIVKDLKGPTHKQGGIDLSVVEGNVHFTKGESKIHAKCGCLIRGQKPIKAEQGVVIPTRTKKNKK